MVNISVLRGVPGGARFLPSPVWPQALAIPSIEEYQSTGRLISEAGCGINVTTLIR